MIELLKNNDVTLNGNVIGRIEIDGGVFVGMNFKTSKRVRAASVEEILSWFKGTK